jgi:hypothetical protein
MYDIKDDRGVPVSGGIPPIVVVAVIAAIVLVCIIAGMVLSSARFGHVWPSSKSVNIPL